MIRDLTDDEARRVIHAKWGMTDPDVLPSWIAEMDYAVAPVISEALAKAVAAGGFGYPWFGIGGELSRAYAGFAARHFGHDVDADLVIPTVDVTQGVRLAIEVLSDPGPVAMFLPCYPPVLDVPALTGRERVDLPLDPDAERAEMDLDALEEALRAGVRTFVLIQPHNPWGRAFSRPELEAVRDLVTAYGARVVSDEIHAPLVLPGARHVPYLSLPGTADHAVSVVSASKGFNVAGLKCAQVVCGDAATRDRLLDVPLALNDSWSPLGVTASVAAYTGADEWLAALIARLDGQRALLAGLLAEHLPLARMRPLEATYLAWVDLRAYGVEDPAALALTKGRVQLAPGQDFHPGLPGHVRVNIATSPERLTEIIQRVAVALA